MRECTCACSCSNDVFATGSVSVTGDVHSPLVAPLHLTTSPPTVTPMHSDTRTNMHLPTQPGDSCSPLQSDARTPEDTQHQALMQTAKGSITSLHSGSSKDNHRCCLGSPHRLEFVCSTYDQPDDSQYELLAMLLSCYC